MSSTINVYMVSLDRLRQVIGSRDPDTIGAVVTGKKDFLSVVDDIDEDAEIFCADALAELVNGDVAEDRPGYLCAYALEAICRHVGEEIPCIPSIARASDWIKEVDAAIQDEGLR